MPMGRMFLSAPARRPKKKVLSNKALIRKVRALSNMEGTRLHASALLYSAVALVAGTADVNYFDDTAGLFTVTTDRLHHYYDAHIKLSCATAGGCTVRLLYGFDEDYDGTNMTSAEILNTATDSASGYLSADVVSYKESKNKNRNQNYRGVIVVDRLIAVEQNVPKAFNIRLPLYNRKTHATGGENIAEFYPFMLALSDEADATISVGIDYVYTNLSP